MLFRSDPAGVPTCQTNYPTTAQCETIMDANFGNARAELGRFAYCFAKCCSVPDHKKWSDKQRQKIESVMSDFQKENQFKSAVLEYFCESGYDDDTPMLFECDDEELITKVASLGDYSGEDLSTAE